MVLQFSKNGKHLTPFSKLELKLCSVMLQDTIDNGNIC